MSYILFFADELVVAMETDCTDDLFYYTDAIGGTIKSSRLDGSNVTTLVTGDMFTNKLSFFVYNGLFPS